jgi:hypothetical protein
MALVFGAGSKSAIGRIGRGNRACSISVAAGVVMLNRADLNALWKKRPNGAANLAEAMSLARGA